jgi:hypothetical protein
MYPQHKKHPAPTKRAKIILLKVKSCNSLLPILLALICTYLQSVVRYTFVILDTCHLDILYLCEQGSEDPWLIFEAKKGPRTKYFTKHRIGTRKEELTYKIRHRFL